MEFGLWAKAFGYMGPLDPTILGCKDALGSRLGSPRFWCPQVLDLSQDLFFFFGSDTRV
jgi:hypothetical protein